MIFAKICKVCRRCADDAGVEDEDTDDNDDDDDDGEEEGQGDDERTKKKNKVVINRFMVNASSSYGLAIMSSSSLRPYYSCMSQRREDTIRS